jgi:hypothetical protein
MLPNSFFALILLLLLTGTLGLLKNVEDSINEGENEVGETCSSTTAPGVICQMSVYSIWPTQYGVGYEEIKCKKEYLESLSASKLQKYLAKKPVPAYIAPDKNFYMTDHHHLVRALFDSKVDNDKKVIYVEVKDNWYNLKTMDAFWKKMVDTNNVWLYDENGNQPFDPIFFPSVGKLLDDPFRSLAWLIRCRAGYGKTDIPFADFYWANYLRANLDLHDFDEAKDLRGIEVGSSWAWCKVRPYSEFGNCIGNLTAALYNAIPAALKLAQDPRAASLPGYGQGIIDPPKCEE